MEVERKRIYCFRWSFVSESDYVIETLSLDDVSGSPRLTKLGTGNCLLLFSRVARINDAWSHSLL